LLWMRKVHDFFRFRPELAAQHRRADTTSSSCSDSQVNAFVDSNDSRRRAPSNRTLPVNAKSPWWTLGLFR
jgi:hypothetical protein